MIPTIRLDVIVIKGRKGNLIVIIVTPIWMTNNVRNEEEMGVEIRQGNMWKVVERIPEGGYGR